MIVLDTIAFVVLIASIWVFASSNLWFAKLPQLDQRMELPAQRRREYKSIFFAGTALLWLLFGGQG